MKASSKKLEMVSHFLAALLPTPLAPSELQFPLRKGKIWKHRQIKQAGRWMGVYLETFHKASVHKLLISAQPGGSARTTPGDKFVLLDTEPESNKTTF